MKLLAHPVVLRMALVSLLSGAAFVLGLLLMRWLRRRMVEEERVPRGGEQAVPYQTYAVIQALKQQKFALENEQRIQSRRTKTSEHITSAMMAHLPCGVMFIAPNGIIKQANAAARHILGFRSPLGMSVGELFRKTLPSPEAGVHLALPEAFVQAFGAVGCLGPIATRYCPPRGGERVLKFTFIPIPGPSADKLGVVAVVNDETAMAELREAEILRAEASAEMVLELRGSLRSIQQWAAEIARTKSAEAGQKQAADIAAEVERLDESLSHFVRSAKGVLAAGV